MDRLTNKDLEPFLALVAEINNARFGAVWKADENGQAVSHEPTVEELMGLLLDLHWQGRNAYDAVAAKIEGGKPYAEIMGERGEAIERKEGF
jgi:hypothetical protein